MISVKNLELSYGEKRVLRGVNLEILAGSHVALMGGSGQGKTTLLRVLLGLAEAQHGTVELRGRAAVVFQEPRLLPERTALENINAVLSDTAETESTALEWLGKVGLSDAAALYPSELSGGMQQRVAIARALAYGGDVLLLDEPLKGLDTALHAEMLALLQRESAGKTLLVITHDEADAHALADTVYQLEDGKIRIM